MSTIVIDNRFFFLRKLWTCSHGQSLILWETGLTLASQWNHGKTDGNFSTLFLLAIFFLCVGGRVNFP